ncbi:Ribosomal lysine N-methyltransferase set10 [Yarrowia sp. C11]|nr:Ribosomal lysine N-methyltransferase set10 [Yarrowia sp. C11]
MEALFTWAKDNGAKISEEIEVSNLPDFGDSIVAKSDLKDLELINIPVKLIINHDKAAKEFGEASKSFSTVIDKQSLTKYFFAIEKNKGSDSFFHPYISQLPKKVTTPLYFTPEQQESLVGTNLEFYKNDKTELWEKEFKKLQQFIKTSVTLEDYLYASTIFTSRSFPERLMDAKNEDLSMLIPVLDLINHKPLTPVEWNVTGDAFAFKACSEVTKGSQVFNNYGSKGNEELLGAYGFALHDNEFDTMPLKAVVKGETIFDRIGYKLGLPEKLLSALDKVIFSTPVAKKSTLGRERLLYLLYSTLSDKLARLMGDEEEEEGDENEEPPAPETSPENFIHYYKQGQMRILTETLITIQEEIQGLEEKILEMPSINHQDVLESGNEKLTDTIADVFAEGIDIEELFIFTIAWMLQNPDEKWNENLTKLQTYVKDQALPFLVEAEKKGEDNYSEDFVGFYDEIIVENNLKFDKQNILRAGVIFEEIYSQDALRLLN